MKFVVQILLGTFSRGHILFRRSEHKIQREISVCWRIGILSGQSGTVISQSSTFSRFFMFTPFEQDMFFWTALLRTVLSFSVSLAILTTALNFALTLFLGKIWKDIFVLVFFCDLQTILKIFSSANYEGFWTTPDIYYS
jgi:hypothetical protein